MPRGRKPIFTEDELKQRKYERTKKYIQERRDNDPDFRAKLCDNVKRCVAKKKEELERLRIFYESNKENTK